MIRILTDSTADIGLEEAARMLVDIVPLSVNFGDKSFRELYELSIDEFYVRLEASKELPKTSQPAPTEFLPYFQAAKIAGDSIICILMSSKVSGTYQSANVAKAVADYDGIYIINSHSSVAGLRLLVEHAARLRGEGASPERIVSEIEHIKKKIKFYAVLDTLEYAFKGGRLSRTSMLAGSLLGIKPILELVDGALTVTGNARGRSKAYESVIAEMEKGQAIDYNFPVYFGYTAIRERADELKMKVMDRFSFTKSGVFPVGSVIGTHGGPGLALVIYVTK